MSWSSCVTVQLRTPPKPHVKIVEYRKLASSPGVDVLHRRGSSQTSRLAVGHGRVRACVCSPRFHSLLPQECIPAALQCVMAELSGVVKLECEDPDHYVDGQLEFLEKMTEMMPRDDDDDKVRTSSQHYSVRGRRDVLHAN